MILRQGYQDSNTSQAQHLRLQEVTLQGQRESFAVLGIFDRTPVENAGLPGFEPGKTVLETVVIPFHHSPKIKFKVQKSKFKTSDTSIISNKSVDVTYLHSFSCYL
jgi:hypothetical protein